MSIEQRTTLRFDDLRKHDNRNDCWIAVNSKVYDVTGFLDEHPGGSSGVCLHHPLG